MMKPEVTEVQPIIVNTGASKSLFLGRDETLKACIEICLDCHQTVEQMVARGLLKSGRQIETDLIAILRDCAQGTLMAVDFMLRESKFHRTICAACADICAACAEACDVFTDDETMKACAEVCRRCAEHCRKTAAEGH